ncbi:recombination regulator RecX [Clostridium tetanomorphum]|uniref:Regulatory protein RecX n=2 Tax=Clostridium tetanomorphum TaxID=1553 RepID=A0A923EAT5_CLOTT|nr:recombination regulator RecX [Clostridium tetanomorphum]
MQKRNKDRVNIFVDEEFLFACSAEIVYRFNLKAGFKIDILYIEKIIEEDNYIKCKNQALRIIEKNYKTEKQIYDKLLNKGYENKTIEKVMNFLREYTFLDDSKYVDMYIKEKLRCEGKNKIKYSLLQKGIDENIINSKLEKINSNIEMENLYKIAKNKYNQLIRRENDKKKLYKKLGDFLIRKGYNWEDAKSVLNKLINNDF